MVDAVVKPRPNWLLRIFLAVLATPFVIYFTIGALHALIIGTKSPKEMAELRAWTDASEFRKNAPAMLMVSMFDPDSAQLRGVFTGSDNGKPSTNIACGELNGKNRFGAYVGFKQFIVAPEFGVTDIEPEPALDPSWKVAKFKASWERLCSIPGPYR